MSDLTPQLRDEIALHFRESNDIRGGRIVRDMEEGLTVEQIASRQRTTLDNARNYVRGTEAMLRGELPTAPSMAVKAAVATATCWGPTYRQSYATTSSRACVSSPRSIRRSVSRSHFAPAR